METPTYSSQTQSDQSDLTAMLLPGPPAIDFQVSLNKLTGGGVARSVITISERETDSPHSPICKA